MGCFVKICGIANAADVRAVAELRPDAMGFVFWPGSRRAVKADDVGAWLRDVPTGIKRVGVFVDAAPDDVLQIMERAALGEFSRQAEAASSRTVKPRSR